MKNPSAMTCGLDTGLPTLAFIDDDDVAGNQPRLKMLGKLGRIKGLLAGSSAVNDSNVPGGPGGQSSGMPNDFAQSRIPCLELVRARAPHLPHHTEAIPHPCGGEDLRGLSCCDSLRFDRSRRDKQQSKQNHQSQPPATHA